MQHFDIIVIGSGGGSKITRPAANLGYNVAIIDNGPLGGTCLNRGCIPSKMLIHPADILTQINQANKFNIKVTKPSIDINTLVSEITAEIKSESESIEPLYEAHKNITLFKNKATFIANKHIRVGDKTITADKIFIAAGARPHIPNIPGLKNTPYWTSTEALTYKKIPKSLVVVGGGYIAVELGYYYQSIGTDVTFIVRSNMIKSEDTEIRELFETTFSQSHRVKFNTTPTNIDYNNNQFTITCSDNTTLQAEHCLIATGITPNTDTLNLHNTDIKCNDKGFINVNSQLETSQPNVFAFGDIIGRYQFRHSANFEGQHLFDTVVKQNKPKDLTYPPMPHAVFTNPQVASVGLTEQECITQNIDYIIGKNLYKNSAMGMALRSETDCVKLIFSKQDQRLIGAHIIGYQASSIIHMLIVGINLNITAQQLQSMIYIHPALPEVIRNAARNVH